MKNTLFLIAASVFISFSADAQKQKTKVKTKKAKTIQVPAVVTTSFDGQFAAVQDKRWDKNFSGNYVASFTNAENMKESVEYSQSGALVKTRIDYAPETVPPVVATAITTQYPNAKVTSASKMEMRGVAPYYKVNIVNADNASRVLLVSEDGTITE